MAKGTIKVILDRGYGFITTVDGVEIFFHHSNLQNVSFDSLRRGQEVEFEMSRGPNGRSQAVRVRLVETQAADEGSDDGDDVSGVGGNTGY